MWTHARTPARVPSYKLTLWAFGSGELKTYNKSSDTCKDIEIFIIKKAITAPYNFLPNGSIFFCLLRRKNEPQHDKTNKITCAPSENSDKPGHLPSLIRVFAVPSMGSLGPNVFHVDSKDSDQTGQMPGLIWVFTGAKVIFLVLSCCGSNVISCEILVTHLLFYLNWCCMRVFFT